jgi:cytochrome P450
MSRVFTPRRVAELEPAIVGATDGLLDQLAATTATVGSVDFMDRLAFPLPVTVICELLGVPPEDRGPFRQLAADLTDALELTFDDTVSAVAADAAEELADYFGPVVELKRRQPDGGLISALVAVRDTEDGRLSDEELLANLITLLVAGFETTTGLLGNGLDVLLGRPDLADSLRRDGSGDGEPGVAGFVEEVLRHDSPVQLTTRVARGEGLTVAGLPIPAGAGVVVLIGAANRDPGRYADPDRFDAGRAEIRPLSFGAGAHVCLGNGLARLESRIAFERLLARFGRLERPGLAATRRDRLVLRGYETLPVVVA